MDPELGLFSSKDGGRSFHLSPGDVDPSSLQRLQLCGKLIGLALLHGEEVPAMKLSTPLRRLLLGAPLRPLEEISDTIKPILSYSSRCSWRLKA